MSEECTCHLAPMCAFCVSLDEGEADAWMNGGYEGLAEYREMREEDAQRALDAMFDGPAFPAIQRTS